MAIRIDHAKIMSKIWDVCIMNHLLFIGYSCKWIYRITNDFDKKM